MKTISAATERIKTWYKGKVIPPPENDPNSPIVIISVGHYEQPCLAKLLKMIGIFWLNHWKWIIATFIAFACLLVAIFKG